MVIPKLAVEMVVSREMSATPDSSPPNYSSLIQHDATSKPDNSGGPLFIDKRKVVAINTLGNTLADGRIVQGQYYSISIDGLRQWLRRTVS